MPVGERLEQVKACLIRSLVKGAGGVVMTFDIIEVYKTLVLSCGIGLDGSCEDPKVMHTHTHTRVQNTHKHTRVQNTHTHTAYVVRILSE